MFDLSSYNTFNLKVHAKSGRVINSVLDLNTPVEDRYIILGGGSDVLFTDDFDGTVLINRIQGLEMSPHEDEGFFRVRVGGGMFMDDVIQQLISKGICGLENLSLIPGTVGAAPIQNIGAYGVEIGDYIESVEAVDLFSIEAGKIPEVRSFSNAECQFGYRTSVFKQNAYKSYFITHVIFRLPQKFEPKLNYSGLSTLQFSDPLALRERVIELRNEKLPDPKFVGNAGSFFKNPYVSADVVNKLKQDFANNVPCYEQNDGNYKLAAGWLIDKANCRGIQHGAVGTWNKQALVIVNLGEAQPQEVVAMAKYVSGEVKSKFGIDLVPEVRLYGKDGEQEWAQI